MTRLYEKKNFYTSNGDYSLDAKTKFAFAPFSEEKVKAYLNEIANIKLSSMTPVRTPICITLDLSGSMTKLFENIKFLFSHMTEELMSVGRSTRQYTLIIMIINNGEPQLGYVGDLTSFNCKDFVESLPNPYGMTPLAKSFSEADDILKKLYDVLETHKHWYTVPVFFTITDSEENGSKDDCTKAIRRYSKDIQDGKKLFIEFVTNKNPNGLKLGGYKVHIDGKDSKSKIILFVDALKTASSTDVKLGDTFTSNKPHKENREAFNAYYSDIMLFNFKMCFERLKEMEDNKS